MKKRDFNVHALGKQRAHNKTTKIFAKMSDKYL